MRCPEGVRAAGWVSRTGLGARGKRIAFAAPSFRSARPGNGQEEEDAGGSDQRMLAVVPVLSRAEGVLSKTARGEGGKCCSGNQGRWSWRTKGHRLRVAWVRTDSPSLHLLAPSLKMLPQKAFKLATVPGGKRSTDLVCVPPPPRPPSSYQSVGLLSTQWDPTPSEAAWALLPFAESPALRFGQNCRQRRCKCIWRQKEFRGNGVPAFPVPFTGCLALGRVVLPWRVLCVSLCGADPVFIAPMGLTSLRWVKKKIFFLI